VDESLASVRSLRDRDGPMGPSLHRRSRARAAVRPAMIPEIETESPSFHRFYARSL